MIVSISAHGWDWSNHILFDNEGLTKNKLDKIYEKVYVNLKMTDKNILDERILDEMLVLLKEEGFVPLKIMEYDIVDKTFKKEEQLLC